MQRSLSWMLASTLASSIALAPLAVRVAHAEPTAAELTAAREMFDEGLKLEEKSQWTQALERFRKVAAVKTTPAVRFHIALCLENLGHLVEALDEFERAHADAQADPKGATVATNSQKHIDELRDRVPRVTVNLPEGTTVNSFTVDGKEISTGLIGTAMPLDPGKHTIVIKAFGKATYTKDVDLSEKSKPVAVDVKLVDEGTPPPAETTTTSEPTTTSDTGASKSGGGSIVPWIVGGVGVAALGGAAFMYVKRNGTINDLDAACGGDRTHCPASAKDTADSGKTYTTIGNILVGVGVVAIGTAVVLLLIQPSSSSSEGAPTAATAKAKNGVTWSVGPSPAPLGMGLAATF